jgi:hypothetical protein
VRARARASFNYDNQEGDGLATGISTFAHELWQAAGARPQDIDVASIYDDYPTMVLAQLNDLGIIPTAISRASRAATSASGGFGQYLGRDALGRPAGRPAGGLNGISEAVLQCSIAPARAR